MNNSCVIPKKVSIWLKTYKIKAEIPNKVIDSI